MAQMSIDGLSKLMRGIEGSIADISQCSEKICTRGGEAIKKAQYETGMSMGIHDTGETLDSLIVTKFDPSVNGGSVKITFDGNNSDGNRNAEVAFINNYGKTNQPARPFVTVANAKSEAETIRIAMDEVNKHHSKHNL